MSKWLAVGDIVYVVEDQHFSAPHYKAEFLRLCAQKPGYLKEIIRDDEDNPRGHVLWKFCKRDAEGRFMEFRLTNLPLSALMAVE